MVEGDNQLDIENQVVMNVPFSAPTLQKKCVIHHRTKHFCFFKDLHNCALELTIEINNTRLYWLWIKYVMLSAMYEHWEQQDRFGALLNTLNPVTDLLSYGLYFTKIILILVDRKAYFAENTESLLDPSLWGLSNGLSATYLCSTSIRPLPYTLGWWGNLSMQLLLTYDFFYLAWQYKQRRNKINPECDTASTSDFGTDLSLLKMTYAMTLIVGFYVFRGCFVSTKTLSPLIGTTLSLLSTMIMYQLERGVNLKKIQTMQLDNRWLKYSIVVSMALGLALPGILWTAINSDYNVLACGLSLAGMTALNWYSKNIMTKSKRNCSLVISSPARDPLAYGMVANTGDPSSQAPQYDRRAVTSKQSLGLFKLNSGELSTEMSDDLQLRGRSDLC